MEVVSWVVAREDAEDEARGQSGWLACPLREVLKY